METEVFIKFRIKAVCLGHKPSPWFQEIRTVL